MPSVFPCLLFYFLVWLLLPFTCCSFLMGAWNDAVGVVWEANGSLYWVRLFVYPFLLSLPGLGRTCRKFQGRSSGSGLVCVCFLFASVFESHWLDNCIDCIFTVWVTLPRFCFVLCWLLFCLFLLLCFGFVFVLREGLNSEQMRLTGFRQMDLVSNPTCVILENCLTTFKLQFFFWVKDKIIAPILFYF